MFDTHCHLTFPKLYNRIDEVIEGAKNCNVDRMISVGVTPKEGKLALKLANQYHNIYATVGVHPLYVEKFSDKNETLSAIREVIDSGDDRDNKRDARSTNLVALGEMGLDLNGEVPDFEHQKKVLNWQLELAKEYQKLPIIIHNRQATDYTIKIIRESNIDTNRFVFHCFSGSEEELDKILDLGAMVSLTGIVTFKNAEDVAKASDKIPIQRLMIETDSPYLTPAPYRKVKPNEPKYVSKIAEFLAQRRNMNLDDFTEQMDKNAMKFFRISTNNFKNKPS